MENVVLKEIITNKEELSNRCYEINVKDSFSKLKEISEDMLSILHERDDLCCLSANQLGYTERVMALKFEDGIKFFVNPMIIKSEGLHVNIETCPSIPGQAFMMARNDKITVAYQDLIGMAGSVDLDGLAGDYAQQMIHLLDGVLISDLGMEIFEDYFQATEEERQELCEYYRQSLLDKTSELNKEIESDDELKQGYEAIEFLTAAAKGEVKLAEKPQLSNRKLRKLEKLKKQIKHLGQRYTKKKKKRK